MVLFTWVQFLHLFCYSTFHLFCFSTSIHHIVQFTSSHCRYRKPSESPSLMQLSSPSSLQVSATPRVREYVTSDTYRRLLVLHQHRSSPDTGGHPPNRFRNYSLHQHVPEESQVTPRSAPFEDHAVRYRSQLKSTVVPQHTHKITREILVTPIQPYNGQVCESRMHSWPMSLWSASWTYWLLPSLCPNSVPH